MVASTAIAKPIPKPNSVAPFVDVQSGALSQHGVTFMSQWHGRLVGTSRLIPCEAAGKNIVSLTPLSPPPTIEGYKAFDTFQFVGAETSDDLVTAAVVVRVTSDQFGGVPSVTALDTIKVFKSDGAAQAGAGDIVAGCYYTLSFVDTLDSGAGGLVIK